MTREEMRRYGNLCREIAKECERLRELEESVDGIGAVRAGETGGHGGVSDLVGNRAAKIGDLYEILSKKINVAMEERLKIETYIATLEDPYIRMIITARYVEQKTWEGVAAYVGGGNTSDGVRKALDRWFVER